MNYRPIDFHVHFGRDVEGKSTSLDEIKRQVSINNLYGVVAFPFNSQNFAADSETILRLSQTDKNIIPFFRFDPVQLSSNGSGKRYLRDALSNGYKGIKLHPFSQNFSPNDPAFRWIFDEIAESGLPVLFHTSTSKYEPMSHPENVLELAINYPNQTFVLGHGAGGDLQPYSQISPLTNVYVETSICMYPSLVSRVYAEYGFDRFLFGSDFPYSYPSIEIPRMCQDISEALKRKFLCENAAYVLGLKLP